MIEEVEIDGKKGFKYSNSSNIYFYVVGSGISKAIARSKANEEMVKDRLKTNNN